VIGGSPEARAASVYDDFSDLNDTANPAWTHLTGYVGSAGQTWDASTGQYRMTAPNDGVNFLGFVGSHTGPSFTDVIVSANVVSFIDDPELNGGVFGVGARFNGMDGLGELTGYGYVYEPFAARGFGEMVLYRIDPGISVRDLGSQPVALDPEKDYTFVLEIQGDQLHGMVFEIGGEMVGERFATDATYTEGTSGFFAYSQEPIVPTDVTWDNFSAVPEPGTGLLLSLAGGATLLRRRSPGKR
jgi:hypothetical protein